MQNGDLLDDHGGPYHKPATDDELTQNRGGAAEVSNQTAAAAAPVATAAAAAVAAATDAPVRARTPPPLPLRIR